MGIVLKWHKRNRIADLNSSDPGAYAIASRHLDDEDRQTRLHAIKAVGRIDPAAARSELLRIAERDDLWDRRIALEVLRKTSGRELWPTLLQAAKDPDSSIAFDAYVGLRDLAGPGDVAELLTLADDLEPKRGRRVRQMVERVARKA